MSGFFNKWSSNVNLEGKHVQYEQHLHSTVEDYLITFNKISYQIEIAFEGTSVTN
jgi:hypothetical protein